MKVKHLLIPVLAIIMMACSSTTVASQVLKNASITVSPQIPVTSEKPFVGCAGPIIKPINTTFEQAIIEQTNEIRMKNGLSPLKHNPQLDESARYHSADMSVNDYFDHNTLNRVNGQLSEVCDTWNRIETYYTNWQALAENIAAGQRTPEMAMNGWMNSPDHRHNILSDNYSEIGVGFYEGNGEYRYYWDQNFGARQNVYPLVVDGEKAITKTSKSVPVYIYGDFNRVRLRNDNGPWSDWITFSNDLHWDLPNTPGLHTVTAQMQGTNGNVTSSDTITYAP